MVSSSKVAGSWWRVHAALSCALLASSIQAAMAQPLAPRPRRALLLEYLNSTDSDRDIRLWTVGAQYDIPVLTVFTVGGGVNALLVDGSRTFEEEPGMPVQGAGAVAVGFGGAASVRPIRVGPVQPLAEASFGMMFTSHAFPPGGTAWNFATRRGIGLSIAVAGDLAIAMTYRHVHISNGKGFGHPRNPSYDGNGLALAVSR